MNLLALSTADLIGSLVLLVIGAALVFAYGLIPDHHAHGYAYERWSRRPDTVPPGPAPAGPRSAVKVLPARPFDWRTDDPDLGDRFTPARIAEVLDVPPEVIGIATRGDGSPLRRPAT